MNTEKPATPAAVSGSVWVWRSATICSRCSTRRRKRYAAISSPAARMPSRRPRASNRSAATVPGTRSAGSRPPHTSCSVCATNSISRMPPWPSFTSWPAMRATGSPATASAVPLCSSMRRFMACKSANAAKSRPRRHTNGRIALRNAAPAARSPATGRAFSIAARSQFCAMLS